MTACERLSDRIPEVVHGRTGWTAEEAGHLAGCPDCQAEWELVQAVNRIGAKAPASRDASALAASVLRRVADRRRSRLHSWRSWTVGVAAAAAIAVAVWSGMRRESSANVPVATAAAGIPLPELQPLETAELDSLLQTMEAAPATAAAPWSALGEPTLGDLDADELEQVLGTWEG